MLELSQEERRIIIGGESDKLENIIRQELRELSKLGALEKKRMALNSRTASELGLPVQDLNVSAIAERVADDEREAIQELQRELTDLIARHKALNVENRELINAHLEYSEMMINLMVDSEDPLNNIYGGDGKTPQEKKENDRFFR